MADLPSGTVTFLFTDIEGSTQRWEQHPEAMRQARTRHDALLTDQGPRDSSGCSNWLPSVFSESSLPLFLIRPPAWLGSWGQNLPGLPAPRKLFHPTAHPAGA
jgi:hypothetical protein